MRTTSFGERHIGILDRIIFWIRKRQFRDALSGKIDLAVDLGSGHRALLLRSLINDGIILRGHAVDLSLHPDALSPQLSGESHDLNSGVVGLPAGSADLVISLAILEHLTDPLHHVKEAFRLLRPRQRLILTTPSPYGKPILEFLAYRLHVIDEGEIRDHKHYYTKRELADLLTSAGFRCVKVQYFLFGLNTIAMGEKPQ